MGFFIFLFFDECVFIGWGVWYREHCGAPASQRRRRPHMYTCTNAKSARETWTHHVHTDSLIHSLTGQTPWTVRYSLVLLNFPISRKPGWAELIELGGPAGEQGPFTHRLVTSFLFPSTTVSLLPCLQNTLCCTKGSILMHNSASQRNAIRQDSRWYCFASSR